MATLDDLIKHYDDKTLPKPAYATLLALRGFALVECCHYAVRFKGQTIATFSKQSHAEDFAALGRANTPGDSPIEVVNLRDP